MKKSDMNNSQNTSHVKLLNIQGKEASLSVSMQKDILSAFLEAGFKPPHFCREAMCGKCAAKLLGGEVDMKENFALNNDKLSEGYVLLCQSKPRSEYIVLEYAPKSKKL